MLAVTEARGRHFDDTDRQTDRAFDVWHADERHPAETFLHGCGKAVKSVLVSVCMWVTDVTMLVRINQVSNEQL